MTDITAKIIVKVYLVNGMEKTHTYDMPNSDKEIRAFFREMSQRMRALCRGESAWLYFLNPAINYNPDKVLAIEISPIGSTEIKKAVEKAQRTAGYVRPSTKR